MQMGGVGGVGGSSVVRAVSAAAPSCRRRDLLDYTQEVCLRLLDQPRLFRTRCLRMLSDCYLNLAQKNYFSVCGFTPFPHTLYNVVKLVQNKHSLTTGSLLTATFMRVRGTSANKKPNSLS